MWSGLQHSFQRGPVFDKDILAGVILAWLYHFARQLLEALVLGYRLTTAYVGADRGLFLCSSFLSFAHHNPHLSVGCRHFWASYGPVYFDFPELRVGISNCR